MKSFYAFSFLTLLLVLVTVAGQAQSIGDYRSRTTGNWNDPNTWQVYTASGWVNLSTITAASPVVENTASSTKTVTDNNSHSISLPANTAGAAAGDLLLIFYVDDNTYSNDLTAPAEWTVLYNTQRTTGTPNTSRYRRYAAYYRVANGTEGASVTFTTTSSNERSAHVSYRISAGTYSGVPVDATVNGGTGTSTTPDPPILTSGFGTAAPTLWIAASHSGGDDNDPTPTPPTNYSGLVTGYTGNSNNDHVRMATAQRIRAAASENPGSFTLGSSVNWAAATVAIKGVEGATIPSSASGAITIRNTHVVTVTEAVTVDQVTVEAGGTLVQNANMTIANGTGTDINVYGEYKRTGGTLTQNTGSTLVFNANSKYDHAVNGGTPIPAATWDKASQTWFTGITDQDMNIPANSVIGNLYIDSPINFRDVDTGPNSFEIAGDLHIIRTSDGNNPETGEPFSFTQNGSTLIVRGNVYIEGPYANYSLGGGGTARTLDIKGDLIITEGFLKPYIGGGSGTTQTIKVGGDFTMSGGQVNLSMATGGSGSFINIAGDFTFTGGEITQSGTTNSGFVFNGGTTQVYTSSANPDITNTVNFTVNSGSTLQFADADSKITGGGTFTLSSGATLGIKSPDGINSSGALGHIQTTTRTFNSGASLIYNGSVPQNTGVFSTTGTANTIANLTINNAAGVTLTQPALFINNTLYLTNGILRTRIDETTANILTINNGANVSGASDASFVVGPIRAIRNSGGNFTFPTGKEDAGYIPIAVSNISSNGTYEAELIPQSSIGLGVPVSPLTWVDYCQYWSLKKVSGGSAATATVTMYWNEHSACSAADYTDDYANLLVASYPGTGGYWDMWGKSGASSGSNTAGSVSWNIASGAHSAVISATSFFALGSEVEQQIPLPVTFSSIKAYNKEAGVQVDWTVENELEVVYYIVERSADGINFTQAGKVAAQAQDGALYYSWYDAAPLVGNNYYRVKNVDKDGKYSYSSIVKVAVGSAVSGVVIYPNPVRDGRINLQAGDLKKGNYTVEIYNSAGQRMLVKSISHGGGAATHSISLPASVNSGIYTIRLTGNDSRIVKKFLIQ